MEFCDPPPFSQAKGIFLDTLMTFIYHGRSPTAVQLPCQRDHTELEMLTKSLRWPHLQFLTDRNKQREHRQTTLLSVNLHVSEKNNLLSFLKPQLWGGLTASYR